MKSERLFYLRKHVYAKHEEQTPDIEHIFLFPNVAGQLVLSLPTAMPSLLTAMLSLLTAMPSMLFAAWLTSSA